MSFLHWFTQESPSLNAEVKRLKTQLFECEQLLLNYATIDAKLRKLQKLYSTLSGVNQIILRAQTVEELYTEICRTAVINNGFVLCWIGNVDTETCPNICEVKICASYGRTDYLKGIKICAKKDDIYGQGPSGTAIREDRAVYVNNYSTDPVTKPWKERADRHGLKAAAAIPLHLHNEVVGVLTLYADEVDFFDESQISLLNEMSADISFALQMFLEREQKKKIEQDKTYILERLKKTLRDTIEMAALVVEKRDPYTAGHQKRVALLCTAIGKELALSTEQIEGLYYGALIHDIGKIAVPAEILSKPGLLTELEREMIKVHPKAGFDCIKNVNFSWPIAQMILQHHERLDGSGYPAGLKGDLIILEARILTVSDVVEAMVSHRPYRSALGLSAALEEIRKNRGTYYDEKISDACINLLMRDKKLPK